MFHITFVKKEEKPSILTNLRFPTAVTYKITIISVSKVKLVRLKKSPLKVYYLKRPVLIRIWTEYVLVAHHLGPRWSVFPQGYRITYPSNCIMGGFALLWKHLVEVASQTGYWTRVLFWYDNNHRQVLQIFI